MKPTLNHTVQRGIVMYQTITYRGLSVLTCVVMQLQNHALWIYQTERNWTIRYTTALLPRSALSRN